LHSPWNVPIHMPRTLIGVSAESRSSISRAALLVNVTASTESGDAWPVASSHAMRVVSTRVLPLPAPASTSAEPCGSVTASSCCGLRWARSGVDIDGRPGGAPGGAGRLAEPGRSVSPVVEL
jgi:hypothetical protein